MYDNKLRRLRDSLFIILLLLVVSFPRKISSTSITFSYHTCLPNVDLINIRTQSEHFHFQTRDFRLYLSYTCENQSIEYQFGNGNFSFPYSSSFDYQFQKAIDYYQEIDTWHYVNVTFNDYLAKVFISFNGDESRLIPLIDYRTRNNNRTKDIHVDVLVDEQQTNVTCLLPHSGFQTQTKNCSINIKTCEYRICTSSNPSEQYCPLFKIFDCRPFTDLECGLKTIPVRCLHNHCQNRGVCYVDLLRNLTQCVCPSGFAGNQCQYSIDECQSSPCPKHSHCIDLPNSYTCVCDPGWTGKDCSIDIDECQTIQPCKAAKSCINLPGSYKCDCFESFGGQNCEMTLDPCLSQPCLNNASQCHPILESDNVVFRCTCQLGFTGHRCETNINDCEGIVCPKNHTFCVDGINSFDCQCRDKFVKNSEGFCVEQNACHSFPCQSNGTCYPLSGGQYRCICPPTYTGSHCEEDIDECQVFPSICRNGGTCVNEHGSYRCYCPRGWTGVNCEKAVDYCASQPCLRNGTCRNQIGGFECQCVGLFTGDVCEDDVDECLTSPCLNNGTCENYLGGFHCRCPTGYFGSRCEHSPSECRTATKCPNSHLCIVNDTARLQDTQQLPTNTCRTERERILDGYFQCIDQRSIANCDCPRQFIPCPTPLQSCPCRNGGTCFWSNSTDYRCYCPWNFTGKDCSTPFNPCSSQPCYHNGTCQVQNQTFTCQCPNSTRGSYCQDLLDPCRTNPCLHSGRCERLNEHYRCSCPENYTGDHCQSIRTPCLSQPCQNHGQCLEVNQTFECQCLFNTQGQFCEEKLDLCQTKSNTSLCLNGGTCRISHQTIQCHCLPGFTGLFCEENINECYTKPCSPHGNCVDLINGYQCQCHPEWYGYNCDRQQSVMSKSLILRSSQSSIFQLRQSNINISKILSNRHSFLPIRIQYEFRTTVQSTSLLAIGRRLQQDWTGKRIVTNLDRKVVLSTFIDDAEQWTMVIIEVYPLWVDVRIGKNAMSQRFYIPSPTLESDLQKEMIFGYRNYTGCVREIEISYSQAYSILLTDQFVQLNSNRALGCQRTNACEKAICRKNELCIDHWFYHTCECQSPFYGHQCDQIAPLVLFNQSSIIDLKFGSSIANLSLFFNTIEPNGTLFELFPIRKRSTRSANEGRILGKLVNGRFDLILIDTEPKYQEYEIRTERKLNDGLPHEVQLNLKQNQLIIDRIYNQSWTKINHQIHPEQLQLNSDAKLSGWLQDLRVNNRMISLGNSSNAANQTILHTEQRRTHPCYPSNPCENQGVCLVTNTYNYRCQCEENWFGANCTQVNLCQFNQSQLCPDGFTCQTINDDYQECLATGTFQGNASSIVARVKTSEIGTKEFSFRLRANRQVEEHLVTMRNLNTSNAFSLFLSEENFRLRQADDLFIPLENHTSNQWTTYHFQWFNDSTLIFNNQTLNSTFADLFLPDTQLEIRLGQGFRGCLEYFLLGSSLYLPFYNQTRVELLQLENIPINNCTFDDLCRNLSCEHGRCVQEFDQGTCRCNRGWEGEFCEKNIDECQRGNNCAKEHSQCVDQLDGYYTCQCHEGFTGKYCETNIDECASNPCANGGRCIDLINGYLCNCTNNYISSNCSVSLDETCFGRRRTCQNNGTCHLKSTNLYVDAPQTECQCPNGYSGSLCERDACSTLHCRNNGTCHRLPVGQAECLCPKEWQGKECEDDVNECSFNQTNVCLNNGICSNLLGSYYCQCPEYYLGRSCEIKHLCLEQSLCLNHGSCRPAGENYYCECPTNYTGSHCEHLTCEAVPCGNNGTCLPASDKGFSCNCASTGYEGERCEMEIDECLSNPCANNASCVDQINGFICSCPRSFTGRHCEKMRFLAVLGFSYHYVIWPGVAVVLLLMIILLSVLISRIRESRRSRGTYRPALNENGQSSRVEFSMILKPPPEERLI